ncbi:MAG: hypothetical protein JJV98_05015 [Desulfosarcina sp.]|nr:hypothetical protein [Desulfobacterales bacterium]
MACRHLQIEITSRCNLRCHTCLYGHYPERWAAADLDEALYEKILAGQLFGLRLATLWRRVELVLPSLRPQPTAVCPKNPLTQAFVGADGTVSPCVYLNPPVRSTVLQFSSGTNCRRRRPVGNVPIYRVFRVFRFQGL